MKLTLFDRTAFERNRIKLEARNAPSYIIEAYNNNLIDVVNKYYELKTLRATKQLKESLDVNDKVLYMMAKDSKLNMVQEARRKRDMDFIKLLYQVSNLDILTGNRRIPKGSRNLIKQSEIMDLGLTKLSKKLR